eukprot:8281626-Ditylum_brightwellii.AAC.1
MSFSFNKEVLDHVLGPAKKGGGNEMAQWMLTCSGNVVPCQTLRSLKVTKLNIGTKVRSCNLFDSMVEMRW